MAKGKLIEGLGIVFNKESEDLGGFREVIAPEAVGKDGKILKQSDIWFLMNHQRDTLLARSREGKGSLKLSIVPEGVKYSFTAPDSPKGSELVSYLERGEVSASSFAFTVAPKGETWLKRSDGYLRTITEFSYIFDVSAVFDPAYRDTYCELREGTPQGNVTPSEGAATRMTDEQWKEGHSRARLAGQPGPEEFKAVNVLQLFDDKIKIGDEVSGDEINLLVRMIEERGVEIPGKRFDALTSKQQTSFRSAYVNKAIDLKPEVKRAHKFTAEEQALFNEYEKLKGKK